MFNVSEIYFRECDNMTIGGNFLFPQPCMQVTIATYEVWLEWHLYLHLYTSIFLKCLQLDNVPGTLESLCRQKVAGNTIVIYHEKRGKIGKNMRCKVKERSRTLVQM